VLSECLGLHRTKGCKEMAMDLETSDTGPTSEKARTVSGTPAGAMSGRPTERVVAAIWEDVLQRDGIAPTDDFFDLGGTSLDLIRVFARVNDEFNLSLNGSVLDEEATVVRMANCIDAARRASA
jgi:acyl carrier protein